VSGPATVIYKALTWYSSEDVLPGVVPELRSIAAIGMEYWRSLVADFLRSSETQGVLSEMCVCCALGLCTY